MVSVSSKKSLNIMLLLAGLTACGAGNETSVYRQDLSGASIGGDDSQSKSKLPNKDLSNLEFAYNPKFKTLKAMNARTDAGLTDSLVDIASHLPGQYGNTYFDEDEITWAHETTHGINSYIRNYLKDTGRNRQNAFYVLENRYLLLEEPDFRKSEVADYIPRVLHGPRYQLYIEGSSAWDDSPLYIWDEWVAYVNGSQIGVDLESAGKWRHGWRDGVTGTVEFNVYAIGLAMAVSELDTDYFERNYEFVNFLAWNLERGMSIFKNGRDLDHFRYDIQDQYLKTFLEDADAAPMRDFLVSWYGKKWCERVFGPGNW